ncbi:hypothetical protein IV203_009171 [Nitzschia inconspicua]|uniref:Uncharacterized protein n=1 Tax=Nitzschia inconspicua TaxID=303405 RepID=A0A9K3KZZ1_9STRA|nr:hypothetical protein IV203_009171 [Nitzschia inconspicua]
MQAFCHEHLQEIVLDDWSELLPSSRMFLEQLGLPAMHPFCNISAEAIIHPSAPEMGPPAVPFNDNLVEALVTNWYYYVPPSIALFLVWFFLFAGYIAPLGTATLLWFRYKRKSRSLLDIHPVMVTLTFVSCWIVMTDDQYVYEFGRIPGVILLTVSLGSLRVTRKHIPTLLLLLCVCWTISPWELEDPANIPSTTLKPGLYYNKKNPMIHGIVSKWQIRLPDYSQVATPFWLTGDARTGMPYTFGYVDNPPRFHRVWLPTFDDEYVAMDIAFPIAGHDWEKPLYLLFHGLNGGSKEGYVIDFCHARNNEGSTCVVMIARGLGGAPIQGWTFFHGARIKDAHSAAAVLRNRVKGDNQVLAGVGYSLGAIVLNHYVASFGTQVALDVSVAISGALDCTFQEVYNRSQRIWQTMIIAHMRDQFLYPKWGNRIIQKIGKKNYQKLMRAENIVEADQYIGVMYNGYKDILSFYSEMSAVLATNNTNQSRHFAIPHLVLQSFDDPISSWRTNAANDPSNPFFPSNIVMQENCSNLVILLTERGGHVGWPMGYFPHTWEYMNTYVAAGFVSSYAESLTNVEDFPCRNKTDKDRLKSGTSNSTFVSSSDGILPVISMNQAYS